MPCDEVTDAQSHQVGKLLHEVADDLSQQLRRVGIR